MRPLPLPESLETPRLTLRPWTPDDAEALREALAESVEQLLPWIPWATPAAPTADEAAALVAKFMRERASGVNFIYAVFSKADARLVGGIGYYARVGAGALEIGYWIRSGAAGSGFATESAQALTEAGIALGHVMRLEMHVDARNTPSIRVPQKLGYHLAERHREEDPRGGGEREILVWVLEKDAPAA